MIIAFEIPEDAVELRSWLDKQLVGLQLGQLVEELRVLGGVMHEKGVAVLDPASHAESLGQILERDIQTRVLQQGTIVLTDSQIQAFFRSPDALLDLQDEIYVHGGVYWQSVPRTDEHNRLSSLDFEALRANVRADEATTSTLTPVSVREPSSQVLAERKSWKNAVLAATILAMSVLVTLAVLNPSSEPKISGTGFGTPGLFDNNVNSQLEYFQRMSVANDKWQKKVRKDSTELLAALKSYSQDCKILIDLKHPALDDRNERWLKSKCGEWKGKIDEIVAALESDKMSFEDAAAKADEVVGKLVKKLNTGPTEEELQQVG